jgi:mannobiose 2-epimerase
MPRLFYKAAAFRFPLLKGRVSEQKTMTRTGVLIGIGALMAVGMQKTGAEPTPPVQPSPQLYRHLADEVDANLRLQVLDKWFPAAADPKGGFFQNYNQDWSRGPDRFRGVVYESRLTWTAAQAAMRYPEKADFYRQQSRNGLTFLAQKMWDHQDGGFFWAVDENGKPAPFPAASEKAGYGNAFAIFAAAANYQATKDPAALDLAKNAFTWYDRHAHDQLHGGYLEVPSSAAAGSHATTANSLATGAANPVGARGDQKSMNTSIHLLEAFTSLYQVWPDPTVKKRLEEMLQICQDKIYAEPGYLILFFSADWEPQPSDDSYGHDVEAAFLLTEAAATIGSPDDPKTWHIARRLVDHALEVGVDPQHGGLYNSGGVGGGNYSNQREWWVEAEFLNALLLMHQRYGHETGKYWEAFVRQWDWINQYQIDKVHGGWYPRVYNDGTPVNAAKSDAWTECYHQARAMLVISARLREMAESK